MLGPRQIDLLPQPVPAVRWGADQRKELEHLCRYITRPAIANERLKRNRAGQVVLQLKSAFKDGTTHIVMSPLEFMQRLAALVPRPRLHLIRFHGVLAPNAKLRREIVPSPPEQATAPACDHAQGAPALLSWARLLKRVFDIDIEHCPNCGGSLNIAHSHNRRIELNDASGKTPGKMGMGQP